MATFAPSGLFSQQPPVDDDEDKTKEREDVDENDEEELFTDRNNIWMAVCTRHSKCKSYGVAYLDKELETIYVGKFASKQMVQRIKIQLNPRTILSQTKEHHAMHQFLRQNDNDQEHPFKVQTLRRSFFNYEKCKNVLCQVSLERARFPEHDDDDNDDDDEDDDNDAFRKYEHSSAVNRLLPFCSKLNLDDVEVVQSLGALLMYTMQHRLLDQLSDDLAQRLVLNDIKSIPTSSSLVYMDESTRRALSIFVRDKNPSTKGVATAKEGLSLFKLFLVNTKTSAGSKRLREWMTFPIFDVQQLRMRQQHLVWLIANADNGVFERIERDLAMCRDVRQLSLRIDAFSHKHSDWIALHQSLYAIRALYALVSSEHGNGNGSMTPSSPPPLLLRALASKWTEDIQNLQQTLSEQIEVAQSQQCKKLKFKAGVNEELDRLCAIVRQLPTQIETLTLRHKRAQIIPGNADIEYVFKRYMGFFLVIPSESSYCHVLSNAGIVHSFEASELKYFRTSHCEQLNEHFGSVTTQIVALENQLIVQLEKLVHAAMLELEALNETVADVDCLCALAATAIQHGWSLPQLLAQTEENVFHASQAWHPIQETFLCDHRQFIRNDICFDAVAAADQHGTNKCENGRVLLLTGPNQSGKSVYLKQCGIVCYLAHIGSFVPALECRLSVVDKILTRIHCTDDTHSSLSTYSRDCCQMSYLLRNATRHSLCLIDEFGKGTWNKDGIALMTAIVGALQRNAESAPKALIATHFHELFQYDLVQETSLVRFFFMNIHTQAAEEADTKLVFLYKVKRGICTDAFGVECARSAGVTDEVLRRTEEIMDCIANRRTIEPIQDPSHRVLIRTAKEIQHVLTSSDEWKTDATTFSRLIELVRNWQS